MDAPFSIPVADPVASVIISGLPAVPGPGAFWAVLTWVIIPGTFLIWITYHSRRERLRSVHRKLRQLEIRLAASVPSAARASLPRPASGLRPSSLTTRILLPTPAATAPIPVFHRALPGKAV